MQQKKTWYVRKNDGAEFGPVTLKDLLRWSAQCRLVAGNAVSADREEWVPVETIPELEMYWIAHRSDGKEYGPFALAAVPELVAHHVLPADAVLINRGNGEQMPLAQLIEPEEAESPEVAGVSAPAEEPEEATVVETSPAQIATADEPSEDIEALHQAMETLQRRLQQIEDATAEQRAEMESRYAESRDECDALQLAIRQNEEEREANVVRMAELSEALAQAQQAVQEAEQRLLEQASEPRRLQESEPEDLLELRKQTAFMKKNIAVLHADLDSVRRQAALRGKIVFALGALLTLVAAVLILRAGGCGRTDDATGTPPPSASLTRSAAHTEVAAIREPLAAPDPRPPTLSPSTLTPSGPAAGPLASWPVLNVEGVTIKTTPQELVIHFNEGAFSSSTNVSPKAATQLKALAGQLRPHIGGLRLVAEGHSDNIPMRPTAAFADNQALAKARAEAAVAFLKRETGLDAVAATNPGPAPFPNDTPENQRRNRTMVLKVTRR